MGCIVPSADSIAYDAMLKEANAKAAKIQAELVLVAMQRLIDLEWEPIQMVKKLRMDLTWWQEVCTGKTILDMQQICKICTLLKLDVVDIRIVSFPG